MRRRVHDGWISARDFTQPHKPVKRARKLPDHPYTCNWVDRYDALGVFSARIKATGAVVNNYGPMSICQSFTGPGELVTYLGANDQLTLIGRLHEAIAGSDFNAGVVLAESHKTLKMITETATSVARFIHFVRRGNFSAAADALVRANRVNGRRLPPSFRRDANRAQVGHDARTLADNVLAFQYGWRPLLQDVYTGAQYLAHQTEAPATFRVKVSLVRRYAGVFSLPSYSGAGNWIGYSKRYIIWNGTEQNNAKLLGLTNPATVAWELLPGSFVADWFLPIGDYLAARGTSSALKGSFTITDVATQQSCGWNAVDKGTYIETFSHPSWYKQGKMSRTVSSTLYVPTPEFKPLSRASSWQHCVNAIALVVSSTR